MAKHPPSPPIDSFDVAPASLRLKDDSDDKLRQITNQIPGMVYQVHVDPSGGATYLFISAGARDLFGVSPQEVMANSHFLTSSIFPADRPEFNRMMRETRGTNLPVSMEFRIVPAGGSVKWVQLNSAAQVTDAGGTVRNGILLDITARKQAETELRESEERWKAALASTADGVWDWTPKDGLKIFSPHKATRFGYGQEEFDQLVQGMETLIHPDDLPQLQKDRHDYHDGVTRTYSVEHRIKCKDGSWRWVVSKGMAVARDANGRPSRMIGTYSDVSERKRSESLIWQQANFDHLTGLPNRRMLRDRMEQEIRKGRRDGLLVALLFIDLDHFKEVNDTLGHDKGDLLLVQAAQRIRDCVRDSDTVARMGGDEFTVLVPELTDAADLERVLQHILQSLSQAFNLDDDHVFVSASVGITMYPQDGVEVETLFKNADQALYAAKGAGRNRFSFFTPALQEAAQHRARLSNDLRSALSGGQLSVYYQPIVELASKTIYKAEALLRWRHPVRGFVGPAEFIPLAESTGLIGDIGNWVFQQAAQQVKRMRNVHDPRFQISVNRSPVQFHSTTDNVQTWAMQLVALGLPGEALAVEITEGLLLAASASVTEQLLDMRDSGIQVSLDDFGTGYSSLSYLQRYDIDFIKIDQAFVRHLIPASTDLALCQAIIVMAHALGIKVVAEGVETQQQCDLLTAAGCDYGQGYLFARPMPAAEFEAFLSGQDPKKS
jgi:diguanylate cyclase (GGDEF)-like protein/PAS domain S-box-containing protein